MPVPEREALDMRTLSMVVIALVAAAFALQWAKAIVAPILMGVTVSYALTPAVNQLRRWRIPHAAGAGLMLTLIAGLIGWGAWTLSDQAQALIDTLPQMTQKIRSLTQAERGQVSSIQKVEQAAADLQAAAYGAASALTVSGASAASDAAVTADAAGPAPRPRARSVAPARPAPGPDARVDAPAATPAKYDVNIRDYLLSGTLGAFALLAQIAVVFGVALFLLASGDNFRRKLVKLAGPRLSQKKLKLQTLDEISVQIQRYLVVQLGTSAIVGVGTWLSFYALGMPQSAVWGVVAGVTNLVPYFGATLVGAGATAVALLHFGTLKMALLVGGASFVVHAIVANILAPWWMGRASGMSPFVVFVVVLLFGWLWGIWGLLLGVPILMAVKAVCDRVEELKGVSEFLGA